MRASDGKLDFIRSSDVNLGEQKLMAKTLM